MENINFLFYDSFWKSMEDLPDDQYIRVSKAFIRKGLYGTEPDLSPLENALINQMFVNVQAAKDRYGRSKENGAKGGRTAYVPPAEWQDYLKNHTQKETAEHFNVSVDTLQRWIKKTAKPQNLTVTDTDTVTVTDTDTDTVTSILINNNNSRSRRGASEAPSLPALKEGERWVTEPYVRPDGKVMADYKDASGEVRSMFIG